MSAFGRAMASVRAMLLHRRHSREMRAEMEAHIEQAAARNVARGMSAEHAMQEARREFGNIGELREHGRDARGARWVGSLYGDVQYALRHFARTPATTLTIVLILMLGVTVNAVVFAFVDAAYNRPPPGVPDDPTLVTVRGTQLNDGRRGFREYSYPELVEYSKLGNLFGAMAGWTGDDLAVDFKDETTNIEAVQAQFVTPNFFRLTGLVLTGPGFQQSSFGEHASPEMNAVISEALANKKFGSVQGALNQSFTANNHIVRVVGVAPPRFAGVTPSGSGASMWLPLSAWRVLEQHRDDPFSNASGQHFRAVARLAPGVSVDEASAVVEQVALRTKPLTRYARVASMRFGAAVSPMRTSLADQESSPEALVLLTAMGTIVVLILLVCTATVGSLLIASTARRRNELAVRLAIGASRTRIIRQLLTETVLLSLCAAAIGLLLYWMIVRTYSSQVEDVDLSLRMSTVVFTTFVAIGAALLCGLTPALQATRHSLNEVLKDSSAGLTSRSRLQRTLIVAQVAFAQPLLVCLAVFVSVVLRQATAGDGAVSPSHLVVAELDIHAGGSSTNSTQIETIEARIAALPGVLNVSSQPHGVMLLAVATPPRNTLRTDTLPESLDVAAWMVAPDFFETMGIAIEQGRTFRSDEHFGQVVAPIIITADIAEQLFPGQDPIGKRMVGSRGTREVEIVGVISSNTVVRTGGNRRPRIFTAYRNMESNLLIRTSGQAEPLLPVIRNVIIAEAPLLPIRSIKTVEQINREEQRALLRATGAAAGAGLIVMLLAAVGLYAVVALSVSQRRREIGIRITVGARPQQVVTMFLFRGIKLSLIGLAIGLPVGLAALYALTQQIRNMPTTGYVPVAIVICAVVLLAAGIASWLPARRAARVSPMVALQST